MCGLSYPVGDMSGSVEKLQKCGRTQDPNNDTIVKFDDGDKQWVAQDEHLQVDEVPVVETSNMRPNKED